MTRIVLVVDTTWDAAKLQAWIQRTLKADGLVLLDMKMEHTGIRPVKCETYKTVGMEKRDAS